MSSTARPAVTFLFSDIEGSTHLAERLGGDWPGLLARHRSLVRNVIDTHHGMEAGTEGDSFFVVFPDARSGVRAAIDIQRALDAEPWPKGADVRVRIGVHTGDALQEGNDYIGVDVHRAARVMATGHGGQIVISDQTRVAMGQLPDEVEVRDLGEHRLRGLTGRERLFQVVAPGLRKVFPALRTVDAIPNNLPSQPTEMVGRDRDLAGIGALLEAAGARLITITGPGGIGKTRLAVQAAADRGYLFDDGVYFVDLSEARDLAGMLNGIVRAVGVNVPADADARDALVAHLQTRIALLVLDNFEQVMEAAPAVADVLARCPRLTMLITSREALRIRGERLVPLTPLAVPSASPRLSAADALRSDAIRLFVARAGDADPDFRFTDDDAATVATICTMLDGLPLAIELAAASIRLFPTRELLGRLRAELDHMPSGPRDLPMRQRTLRSTIEWSYELLSDREKTLFLVLSVFSSARVRDVLAVAERIPATAGSDVVATIAALLDKSLLRSEIGDETQRLQMLGTIRRFAMERLAERPELAEVAARVHAEHFADLATRGAASESRESAGTPNREWEADLGNVEVAWRYFVDRADAHLLGALLEAMWSAYEGRGWYHNALGLAEDLLRVLAASRDTASGLDEVTLRLTLARGLLAMRGYTPEVERLYREAVQISESLRSASVQLPVLRSLASFYLYRGELERTVEIGRRLLATAREGEDSRLELEGHMIVGPSMAFLGDIEGGLAHLRRVMDLFDPEMHGSIPFRMGPSPGVAAPTVSAMLRWWIGQPKTARELVLRAEETSARLRHPYSSAYGAFHAGVLTVWRHDFEGTRRQARKVLDVAQAHDYRIWIAVGMALDGLADVALGDAARGLARTDEGVAMYEGIHTPPVFWPVLLGLQAHAYQIAGRHDEALTLVDRAHAIETDGSPIRVLLRLVKAEILFATDRETEGRLELRAAVADAEARHVPMMQVAALTRLIPVAGHEALQVAGDLRGVLDRLDERDDEDFGASWAAIGAHLGAMPGP